MKRILGCFKEYKVQTMLAQLFKFAEAALDLLVPLVIAAIIDRGIAQRNTGFILSRGGLLVLFAAVGLALALTAQFFSAKAAIGVATTLRARLFDKIHDYGYKGILWCSSSLRLSRCFSL